MVRHMGLWTNAMNPSKNEKGQFVLGHPGVGGRPAGSRNKLGEAFIQDLYEHWQKNGPAALQGCLEESPAQYCRVVASLLPRDVNHNINQLDAVSDDDIAVGLAAIRAARASGATVRRSDKKEKSPQLVN